ncbi:hypothetical protein A0H81_13626 [Grifola frondosa]|uniref:Uncharacterized protein n=1 Tax=Grifola frondosa TaxID=5627 RepID=A0A1C7LP09_GRIFR|nr:hypothetical protein A0H81_13626 [Grifola frondosa]
MYTRRCVILLLRYRAFDSKGRYNQIVNIHLGWGESHNQSLGHTYIVLRHAPRLSNGLATSRQMQLQRLELIFLLFYSLEFDHGAFVFSICLRRLFGWIVISCIVLKHYRTLFSVSVDRMELRGTPAEYLRLELTSRAVLSASVTAGQIGSHRVSLPALLRVGGVPLLLVDTLKCQFQSVQDHGNSPTTSTEMSPFCLAGKYHL